MKAGWASKTLGDVCGFVRGPFGGSLKKSIFVSDGFAVYEQQHAIYDQFDDIRYFIDAAKFSEMSRFELRPNDLIMSCSGTMGKVAIVPPAIKRGIINQALLKLTPAATLMPHFLKYWMDSPGFQDSLKEQSGGAAIQNVASVGTLKQIKFACPPLPEQHRIVAILDEAFDGIATAKANAEKNLLNARALFARLSATVLDQLVPISRTATLEDVAEPGCSLSYGIVQPGEEVAGGLPIVRPVDLNDGVVSLDGLKRIDPTLAKSYDRTTLKGSDILLCVRGTTGALALADRELAGANVTRGIVPIRFDTEQVSQEFGYCLMRSEPVQMQIRAKTYGTALMQINIRDLRQLTLLVPPKSEQATTVKRFEELTTSTEQLVAVYQQKLIALDDLKKSLLNQAFTGQL